MVSLLSLLVSAPPAQAQTSHCWSITYSTNATGKWSYNSSTNNQDVNGTWDNINFYTINGSDKRSNSISGIVTATLTWIPATGQTLQSDPPPSPVSIIEYANATESPGLGTDPNTHGPAGSASDGLSDNPVVSGNGYISSGYHVTSASPDASGVITLKDTLSAINPPYSMTQGYPPYTRWPNGANYVGFTVYPVTINVSGTTCTGTGLQVLTGQQVSATLSIDPTFTIPNTTYQWTKPGDTFETYGIAAPTVAHPTQLVPLSADDLAATTFSFYDKTAESITVTGNATVVCPDGTQLAVTGQSPPIAVQKPTVTKWVIAEGYVQSNTTANGHVYGLYGDLSNPNADSANGMIWSYVTVSVPAPLSGGQCTFTQLINPDRLGYSGNNSTPLVLNNGILGLDASFDYSSRWSVTATGSGVDSPNQPTSYTGLTEIRASDAFTTYVMYQPPGTNSVWVPLDKISWSWGMTTNLQGGQWVLTASYPATAGQAPIPTPSATNDPPQWTVVH